MSATMLDRSPTVHVRSWWRRYWIVERDLPDTVRALALGALALIALELAVTVLAPWLRRHSELIHATTGPRGGSSPYVPLIALRLVPAWLAVGMAFGLVGARFAGLRIRVIMAVVWFGAVGTFAAATLSPIGYAALQALLPRYAPAVQALLIGATIVVPALLLLWSGRLSRPGWLGTALLGLVAAVPLALLPLYLGWRHVRFNVPEPYGPPAAMLYGGLASLSTALLIPYFLVSGAALYRPALGLASRLSARLAAATGRRQTGSRFQAAVVLAGMAVVLVALIVQRLKAGNAGGPHWGLSAAVVVLALAAVIWLGGRTRTWLTGPQFVALVVVTMAFYFVVPNLPGLGELTRDLIQLTIAGLLMLVGAVLVRTRQAGLGTALVAVGLVMGSIATAYLATRGTVPAAPLYGEVTVIVAALLLAWLAWQWRRAREQVDAAAGWAMEAMTCLVLVTVGSALLDPAGQVSGFTWAGILVALWTMVTSAREWTASDRPWLPRASGVVICFGFFVVVYAVIAWLQLHASPEAAGIQDLASQGLRVFALPLVTLALGRRLPGLAPVTVGSTPVAVIASGSAKKAWTVLVYMAGDNDLALEAGRDLAEMQTVGSGDQVTVLVQLDRLTGSGSQRYRVEHGRLHTYPWNIEAANLNFGAASTLADFVRWGLAEAPAEHTMLVIWNHGGGWQDVPADYQWRRFGYALGADGAAGGALFAETLARLGMLSAEDRAVALDEHSQDFLDNQELQQALAGLGRRLDIVGFDACLMNMVEVAYQLRDVADHMVGSQEDEPLYGWPYDRVLGTLANQPTLSPVRLARAIVEHYRTMAQGDTDRLSAAPGGSSGKRDVVPHTPTMGRGMTLSALDLAACDRVADALDRLGGALLTDLDAVRPDVDQARETAQRFANPAYVDLADLARLLGRATTEAVRSAAADMLAAMGGIVTAAGSEATDPGTSGSAAGGATGLVVGNAHVGAGAVYAHGVSVYLPMPGRMAEGYGELDLARRTRWGAFLVRYAGSPGPAISGEGNT